MTYSDKFNKKNKHNKKRKLTIFLVFIIIPLFISFLLGEILVRKFSKIGYLTPDILKQKSLQYERSVFTRSSFPQKEQKVNINGVDIYINEKGYRGRNFETEKPEGKVRIIFYGGSSVFDYNIPEGKDWPHTVEKLLHEKGFSQIEVINAGTPANKSFEAWGRLFAEGYLFSPDYVVLSAEYNDTKYFRLNLPILRQYNWFAEKEDPFITYQNSLDRFLSEHSQLYVRLRTRYYLWKYKPNQEGAETPGEYSDTISDLGLIQYRLSIEMFADLARNIKAVPVLMIEPRLVAWNNTEDQKKRINYASPKLTHKALSMAFDKTDEIVKEVSRNENITLIDRASEINGKDEFFADQVHLTEKGSKEVARIVAEEFAEILKK